MHMPKGINRHHEEEMKEKSLRGSSVRCEVGNTLSYRDIRWGVFDIEHPILEAFVAEAGVDI